MGLEGLYPVPEACKFCGSTNIIERGVKKYKHGAVQQYRCKDCGKRFVINVEDFHKTEYNLKVIILVLDPYFKGVSLRKIADYVKQFYGLPVHYSTILRWIKKYAGLMKAYIEGLKP